MLKRSHTLSDLLLITLISCALYLPFLGGIALFDWDEINFAECAREMLITGNFSEVQLNFQPFWEKPPLFIWLQVISMKLFGITEFAARFPNAICSIFTLSSLYLIGRKEIDRRMGWYWVLFYIGSLLPHFYFRTGIIDPWFNYFILIALYFFFKASGTQKNTLYFLLSGFFSGLAVLTKGPAALLIIAATLSTYLIWTRQLKKIILTSGFLFFSLSTLLVSGSWFLVMWLKGETSVIHSFITYQLRLAQTKDAGHGGPFFYHFIILLIGCFPASLFFIAGYSRKESLPAAQVHLRYLFLSLFWTVLIIFSLVETKIVHYSSLCYFPLTFVAAQGFQRFVPLTFNTFHRALYWFVAGLLFLATTLVACSTYLLPLLIKSGLLEDKNTLAILGAEVPRTGLEFLLPVLFITAAILIYKGLKENKIMLQQSGLIFNGVFITASIYWLVPLISGYTQDTAISFYRASAQQDCYLETYKFKSYGYLFYGERQPRHYQNSDQQRSISKQLDLMETEGHSRLESYATANSLWMVYGAIDKPAYIVAKSGNEKELLEQKDIYKLYSQNGFSFFVRLPPNKHVK